VDDCRPPLLAAPHGAQGPHARDDGGALNCLLS
jgi:hypothetical protein